MARGRVWRSNNTTVESFMFAYFKVSAKKQDFLTRYRRKQIKLWNLKAFGCFLWFQLNGLIFPNTLPETNYTKKSTKLFVRYLQDKILCTAQIYNELQITIKQTELYLKVIISRSLLRTLCKYEINLLLVGCIWLYCCHWE